MAKRKLFSRKRQSHTLGTAPGTVQKRTDASETRMRAFSYGVDDYEELQSATVKNLLELWKKRPVLWVDIEGLANIECLNRISSLFAIHPLAMEDIVNIQERPKIEEFPDHLFVILRMFSTVEYFESEQLAICLGDGVVVTFQERPGDCLESVRERIRKNGGRVRKSGGDYLAYALIDAVVDNYFPLIEKTGDILESLEQKVLESPDPYVLADIHGVKSNLIYLRRTMWPLRDSINRLFRDDCERLTETTKTYLRDCSDHAVQIIEIVEAYREIASGLTDLYLSSISNSMNEVMQVLTIVATVFIPLTFIAGIYGMNFNPEKSPLNMPELNWYWGYPFCIGLMVCTAVVLFGLFYRAGWLKIHARKSSSHRSSDSENTNES